MWVVILLIVVVVGTVVFHFLSPWWWTPLASNWGYVDDTILITFWITGFVFVAVVLFMAYCVFRYRHQKGRRAAYEPENKKLEWWLTMGTTVGVAGMLAPGLSVWDRSRPNTQAARGAPAMVGFDLSRNHRKNAVDMCAPAESCGPFGRRRGTTL